MDRTTDLVYAYRRARTEHPIQFDPIFQTSTMFRHDHIVAALRHQKALSSQWPGNPPLERIPQFSALKAQSLQCGGKLVEFIEMMEDGRKETILAADPPRHNVFRNVLASSFTPNASKVLSDRVRVAFTEAIAGLPRMGEFDFAARIAKPLSLDVIGYLLALDEIQLERLSDWSENAEVDWSTVTREKACRAVSCEQDIRRFFKEHISTTAKTAPASIPAVLQRALDNGMITWDESVGLCREILVAGSGTTRFTVTAAVVELLRNLELQATIRADRTRITEFLNEVLRLQPPLHGLYRRVLQAMSVAGHVFEAGSTIFLNYASANRDESAYQDPDTVRLGRPRGENHLSFGAGRHTCLGRFVAQMVMAVTIDSLLDHFTELRLSQPLAFGTGFLGEIYELPLIFRRV